MKVRSRGMNWGSAEIRCSNGCPGMRSGFSFPSGGQESAKEDLKSQWNLLVSIEGNTE